MVRTHPRPRNCSHEPTVNVITNGIERVICEMCGYVSIRYESTISRDIDRSQFRRKADDLAGRHLASTTA